jgi:hypothetical protein
MTKQDIKNSAFNKAWAQVEMTTIDIKRVKSEIRNNNIGFLTEEQIQGVLRLHEKDLKVWNFILELIEKSNKNE